MDDRDSVCKPVHSPILPNRGVQLSPESAGPSNGRLRARRAAPASRSRPAHSIPLGLRLPIQAPGVRYLVDPPRAPNGCLLFVLTVAVQKGCYILPNGRAAAALRTDVHVGIASPGRTVVRFERLRAVRRVVFDAAAAYHSFRSPAPAERLVGRPHPRVHADQQLAPSATQVALPNGRGVVNLRRNLQRRALAPQLFGRREVGLVDGHGRTVVRLRWPTRQLSDPTYRSSQTAVRPFAAPRRRVGVRSSYRGRSRTTSQRQNGMDGNVAGEGDVTYDVGAAVRRRDDRFLNRVPSAR
ncbi:hypothetical protein AURDEDRAFT_161657 [Auricularia subglabra TFB-10046 SS5]|nr:hypothetical protein AURDEDRAFT_161657 [Auricularia subglabra TFB-10046 SS5]